MSSNNLHRLPSTSSEVFKPIFQYFTKSQSSTSIVKCSSCNESLTSEQLRWHRDYHCINSKFQISKISKNNEQTNKPRRKRSNKLKIKQKKNICDKHSGIIIVNLSDSDDDNEKCANLNRQQISTSLSFSFDNCNDEDSSSEFVKTRTEQESDYILKLKEDWNTPKKSPEIILNIVPERTKNSFNQLQNYSEPNKSEQLFDDEDDFLSNEIVFQTPSKVTPKKNTLKLSQIPSEPNKSEQLIDDEEDFLPNEIVFQTPSKITPKKKTLKLSQIPKNKNRIASHSPKQIESSTDNIFLSSQLLDKSFKAPKRASVSYKESQNLDFRNFQEELLSNSSDCSEWQSPMRSSMLVSPQRTPSPSPCKSSNLTGIVGTHLDDDTENLTQAHKVSRSILLSPQRYGLKVECVAVSEENSELCSPKTNSYVRSPYRGKFSFQSPKRALFSSKIKPVASISVSPDGKHLDLSLEKTEAVSPSKFRASNGYYLDNFLYILNSVASQSNDVALFNDYDLKTIKNFNCLSLQAQKLYVRLFQRKIKWLRISKIEYKDICDKEDTYIYTNELVYAEFCYSEEVLNELNDTLLLLSVSEVQNICKDLKIICVGKKEDLIQKIIKFTFQQKSIVSSFQKLSNTSNNYLVKRVKKIIGKCILINKDVRSVFMRVFMLFSPLRLEDDEEGGQQSHMLNLLMVSLGKRTFPSYEVIITKTFFRTREDLLRMEKCYHLYNEVQQKIDLKKWEEAEVLGKEVYKYYYELKGDQDLINYDASLPGFLRRYTAISLLLHILTHVVEVYQRLKDYKGAVCLLEELLSQNSHLQDYRGRWFDRLALNLEQHLKQYKKSLTVIQKALLDPEVKVGHRLSLSQRAERLLTSKKGSAFAQEFEGNLSFEAFQDAPKMIIQARSLTSDAPGHKRIFINSYGSSNDGSQNITMCSVEELVVSYYETQGYPEGLHCEGRTIHVLFGLYFWDIIYSPVADVFRSVHQSVPFDLDSENFYLARKSALDGRLKKLENSTIEEINEMMENVWINNEGKISIVDWNIFKSIKHLQGLVAGLGPKVITEICRRLIECHRFTRSGFPDLIVWNPSTKTSRIVEVKGPNDKLSTKQMLWLDYLMKIGAVAEVCHVEAVGVKCMSDLKSRRVSPQKKKKNVPQIPQVEIPLKIQQKKTRKRTESDDFTEPKKFKRKGT